MRGPALVEAVRRLGQFGRGRRDRRMVAQRQGIGAGNQAGQVQRGAAAIGQRHRQQRGAFVGHRLAHLEQLRLGQRRQPLLRHLQRGGGAARIVRQLDAVVGHQQQLLHRDQLGAGAAALEVGRQMLQALLHIFVVALQLGHVVGVLVQGVGEVRLAFALLLDAALRIAQLMADADQQGFLRRHGVLGFMVGVPHAPAAVAGYGQRHQQQQHERHAPVGAPGGRDQHFVVRH